MLCLQSKASGISLQKYIGSAEQVNFSHFKGSIIPWENINHENLHVFPHGNIDESLGNLMTSRISNDSDNEL